MTIKRKLKGYIGLPVAAMADIAFLLLIFFILSNVADEDKSIPIELPHSLVSEQETEKYFNVWINDQGEVFFGGKQGTLIGLTTHTTYKLLSNPKTRVLIRASKNVKYEYVNAVLNALKEAGAHHIVLVSKKKI